MARQTLGAIIGAHAQRMGAAPAIIYPDGVLSWAELDQRSNRRARLLVSLGVGQDDLVAVMLPNGAEFHEAVLGVWKAGATPCVLPARLPGAEARSIVELVAPRAVIGTVPFPCAAPVVAPAAALMEFSDAPLAIAGAASWKAVASGGSSGRPKIIVDSMPASIDPVAAPYAAFASLGMGTGGVLLNPGPLYHNMPFMFSSFALLAGARVIGMNRFDAEEFLRLVARHKVEFVAMVPTMMQRIWALPAAVRNAFDLSSLKSVWHMAAPCPPWLKRAWIEWLGPERIFEVYSGTEGGGGTVITGAEWLAKPGSVGKPAPGVVRIRRDDGSEAAAGEVGEIYFAAAGAGNFRYIGADVKTDASGGFSLGDLGHLDADGYLFLADRRSDLILRGGANVYPAEVEAALDAHPAIASSAVVGLPDADLGERVHAIIQLRPGAIFDANAIARHIGARLAKYKWPASYELSAAPLRDDAGKLRRTALKAERARWLAEGRAFVIGAG